MANMTFHCPVKITHDPTLAINVGNFSIYKEPIPLPLDLALHASGIEFQRSNQHGMLLIKTEAQGGSTYGRTSST